MNKAVLTLNRQEVYVLLEAVVSRKANTRNLPTLTAELDEIQKALTVAAKKFALDSSNGLN